MKGMLVTLFLTLFALSVSANTSSELRKKAEKPADVNFSIGAQHMTGFYDDIDPLTYVSLGGSYKVSENWKVQASTQLTKKYFIYEGPTLYKTNVEEMVILC